MNIDALCGGPVLQDRNSSRHSGALGRNEVITAWVKGHWPAPLKRTDLKVVEGRGLSLLTSISALSLAAASNPLPYHTSLSRVSLSWDFTLFFFFFYISSGFPSTPIILSSSVVANLECIVPFFLFCYLYSYTHLEDCCNNPYCVFCRWVSFLSAWLSSCVCFGPPLAWSIKTKELSCLFCSMFLLQREILILHEAFWFISLFKGTIWSNSNI